MAVSATNLSYNAYTISYKRDTKKPRDEYDRPIMTRRQKICAYHTGRGPFIGPVVDTIPMQQDSGMTVIGLRDMVSGMMLKESQLLKPRAQMLAIAENIVIRHKENLKEKQKEREAKECDRISKLLDTKALKPTDISPDECHGRFRSLIRSDPKHSDVVVARCPSPSPIERTDMINDDNRYHTSVFLNPSVDLDRIKSRRQTTLDETRPVLKLVAKYQDPILQQMADQTSVKPLYELAEQVVYRTSEGCKGILAEHHRQTSPE